MKTAKIVAENMRMFRTMRKMTQATLAKRANLSQSTIAQIESQRKNPTLETLDLISGALKISTSGLCEYKFWQVET